MVLGGVLALAAAGPAAALEVELTVDRTSPEAGEPAVFTATADDPAAQFEFRVGDEEPEAGDAGAPHRFTRAFGDPGAKTVTVDARTDEPEDHASDSVTITVTERLEAVAARSAAEPVAGETVEFTATPSGGTPPYEVAWDFTADGTTDASGAKATTAFPDPGTYETRVTVTDSADPAHHAKLALSTTVRRPPPPACARRELRFQLARITTLGCWEGDEAGRYAEPAADGVELNGLRILRRYVVVDMSGGFPQFREVVGGPIEVEEPSASHPGGRLRASDVAIVVGRLGTVYRGPLDLRLPAGVQGGQGGAGRLDGIVSSLFGLRVSGDYPLRLGYGSDGRHYAELDLTVSLPDPFRDGPPGWLAGSVVRPAPEPKRVKSPVTVRVDETGVHYGRVRLRERMAWAGPLPVFDLCWAYAGSGEPGQGLCPPLSLDDRPFLECDSGERDNRWGGTARLELPTPAAPKIGAFTSLAAGRLASLGALRDNFGSPLLSYDIIAEGWALNRFGFGLCVEDPLQVRGDIGVAYFANRLTPTPLEIDGGFRFTAQAPRQPWSLAIDGKTDIFTHRLGRANVTIDGHGNATMLAKTAMDIAGKLKMNGDIRGWLEVQRDRFSLGGKVLGCAGSLCADADGLLTHKGAAVCVDGGTITVVVIEKEKNWRPHKPWRVKEVKKRVRLLAGAGYKWTGKKRVRLVDGRCGFKRYKVERRAGSSAAEASVRIGPGAGAVALRVGGTSRAPKFRLTGPGLDVRSPDGAQSARRPGRWMLIEDAGERMTHVIVRRPRTGTYVARSLEASNPLTGIDVARPAQPFSAAAAVTRTRGGRRVLRLAYTQPAGARVRLVERGPRVSRVIADRLHSRPCRAGRRLGARLWCASRRFRPAPGPGGRRVIEAVVERGGVPTGVHRVTSYRAPSLRRPSRPRVRVHRRGRTLLVAWTRSRGAGSYAVSVRLDDGRTTAFKAGRRCRTVHLRPIGRRTRAAVRVTALRADLGAGRQVRATLRGGARRAGSKEVRLRRSCA